MTKRPRSDLGGAFVVNGLARVERAVRSVSPGPDRVAVGLVGQDRPLSPDLVALAAPAAAAVQPVAAFEVTDAVLRAGSVASQSTPGVSGGWLLPAAMNTVFAASSARAALVGVG